MLLHLACMGISTECSASSSAGGHCHPGTDGDVHIVPAYSGCSGQKAGIGVGSRQAAGKLCKGLLTGQVGSLHRHTLRHLSIVGVVATGVRKSLRYLVKQGSQQCSHGPAPHKGLKVCSDLRVCGANCQGGLLVSGKILQAGRQKSGFGDMACTLNMADQSGYAGDAQAPGCSKVLGMHAHTPDGKKSTKSRSGCLQPDQQRVSPDVLNRTTL